VAGRPIVVVVGSAASESRPGLRLLGELEPGIPVSASLPYALPVVTKAGAFGDEDTLRRVLAAIRH
jgi:uncharacterized protein YgbK (DUF1537 family)